MNRTIVKIDDVLAQKFLDGILAVARDLGIQSDQFVFYVMNISENLKRELSKNSSIIYIHPDDYKRQEN